MIFDELIRGVTDVVTDGIDTIKDVTSDVREEVNDKIIKTRTICYEV